MENISNKMGELIKINVNDEGKQLVSARELYLGLGLNKSNWSRWYPKNILGNEFFSEGIDYIGVRHKDEGNNTIQDFAITLELAKHLAMMARTPKSHEYRNYFIECEKKLKEQPKNLSPLDQLALQRDAILQVNEKQQQFESRLTKIENNSTIDYSQQEHLRELANKVVVQALGGNEAPAYKELGKKAFSSLWNEYKRVIKVNSYKNTLVKNYEKGIEFISKWIPGKELKYMIEGCNAQIRM